jgi:hypothetical protein
MQSGVLATSSGLIGRICVIRSGQLDHRHGHAEIVMDDGTSVFVDVRLVGRAEAACGWSALIYGYDPLARVYWVVPVEAGSEARDASDFRSDPRP